LVSGQEYIIKALYSCQTKIYDKLAHFSQLILNIAENNNNMRTIPNRVKIVLEEILSPMKNRGSGQFAFQEKEEK
jgi:hypothetical protein